MKITDLYYVNWKMVLLENVTFCFLLPRETLSWNT
jgi:hypothetical protein